MNHTFNLNLQLFASNLTTAAEANAVTSQQLTKAREVDFVRRFSDGALRALTEALGVTRRVPMMEGSTLYVYKTTGTLQSGAVAEGEVIPLSRYEREREAVGDITLKKWRKATTAEAIEKAGYAEAVRETDRGMLSDVQKGIRADFFTFLTGIVTPESGTEGQEGYEPAVGVEVTGDSLQAVLARSWGALQGLFEDDAVQAVHFVNPLTVADYLATAQVSVQTAFGMNYIENFLGLGTVVMSSLIDQGEVYSTAKENLVLYYLSMDGDVAGAFDLTSDETGLIGIKSGRANDSRAQVESLIMSGIRFLVEYADGVVKGVIAEAESGEEEGEEGEE